MKLELLVANEEALKVLVETKFDDMQLVWDLSEAFDEVEKAITKFQKRRDTYVKEIGKPDPDNPERFTIPNPDKFSEEMRKILSVDVDIKFPVIGINELKGLKVSVKDIRSWKALGVISNGKASEEISDDKEKVDTK